MPKFPGVNPFIEGQLWEDFHTEFVVALRAQMVPKLGERYFALVEKRVYVERHRGSQPEIIGPDVAVVAASGGGAPQAGRGRVEAPFVVPLAMPEEMRERYITIHLRDSREIVTVVELLSPANKQGGSDGRREYLEKRDAILKSGTHLVELDLLRGGQRLPMAEALPPGDYYAIVSRVSRRPLAEVWPWTLREPLPLIPVPLSSGDADLVLDLNAALMVTMERAGYDRFLDYSRPLRPGVSPEDLAWIQQTCT